MSDPGISIALWDRSEARAAVETVIEAERLGIRAVWTDVGRSTADPVTSLAAALWQTSTINIAFGVVPAFPRHPAVLANQAQALYQIGGTRARLGIGPSHAHIIEDAYGLPFDRPLARLREYLIVLRALTRDGVCRFHGEFYDVDLELDMPAPLPLYMSALRPKAMRLAGELADGVLAWLAPVSYLRDVSLKHLNDGAARGERNRPRLVAAFPCVLTEDPDTVWQAVGPMLTTYGRLPFYAGLLEAAGFDPYQERWSEADLSRVVFWGTPDRIADQVRAALAQDIDEVAIHLYPPAEATIEQVRHLLPMLRAGH